MTTPTTRPRRVTLPDYQRWDIAQRKVLGPLQELAPGASEELKQQALRESVTALHLVYRVHYNGGLR